MAQRTDTLDLSRYARSSGEGRRLELDVGLPELRYGATTYTPSQPIQPARVEISRTAAGYALRLSFAAGLEGECMRCLGSARIDVDVDAREVDQRGADDDDLRSPYVDGDELDLAGWARDALVLALPAQLVCSPGCKGLCPECGERLGEHAHDHPAAPDPRWAKLRELG